MKITGLVMKVFGLNPGIFSSRFVLIRLKLTVTFGTVKTQDLQVF
jgi:hypothetical protein